MRDAHSSRSQQNGSPRTTTQEGDDSRSRQDQADRKYRSQYAEALAQLPPEEQAKFRLAGLDAPEAPDYHIIRKKSDARGEEDSPIEVGEAGGFSEDQQAVQVDLLDPLTQLLEREEEKEFAFLTKSLRGLTAAEVLTKFLTFVFAANDRHPIQSLRRFVATVYQIRPDLLTTDRQKLLARALGYSKAGFSKTVKSNNVKIGVWGRLQKSKTDCEKYSAAHMGKTRKPRPKAKKVNAQQFELWGQKTLQPDLFTTLPTPQRKRKAA